MPIRLKDVLDIATLLVITTGLYFAYDQAVKIRESIDVNNKNLSVTAWSNISTATFELDKIMIENADLQKYFYDGVELSENDKNYRKGYAVAIMMLDYFDYVAAFTNSFVGELPNNLLQIPTWERYISTTLESSPILCRIYLKEIENYGSAIRRIAEPTCEALRNKKLVESSEEKPAKP